MWYGIFTTVNIHSGVLFNVEASRQHRIGVVGSHIPQSTNFLYKRRLNLNSSVQIWKTIRLRTEQKPVLFYFKFLHQLRHPQNKCMLSPYCTNQHFQIITFHKITTVEKNCTDYNVNGKKTKPTWILMYISALHTEAVNMVIIHPQFIQKYMHFSLYILQYGSSPELEITDARKLFKEK